MALAIAFIAVAFLLAGFLALTAFEAKRGHRFFSAARERLDARVSHVAEIVRTVDFGKLVFHAIQVAIDHIVHELAHIVLIVVRFIERFLTRVVRYLRDRRADGESDPRKPLTEEVEKLKEVIRGSEKGDTVE
ncbi:MAG TPA: hypothetical protein VEB18_00180 [Candidatus Paceibacterota bacterium]|nr:hypothetical protein [Candidatus Paceibacterota bacterium]